MMLGVFSTFDVALGLLPGVGLVCLHSQLPPPPPGLLTDWEISIWLHCRQMSQHKTYVWRFGGKPPLCWDFAAMQTWPPYPPLLVGGVVGWFLLWRQHLESTACRGTKSAMGGTTRRPITDEIEVTSQAEGPADWPAHSTNRRQVCRWRHKRIWQLIGPEPGLHQG